ncbi:MAG: hypothetical protein HXY18_04640 [Bryobacteraceae bacterium]|nr:hypothetical protein [Bryobacteraceae bacterium]
MKLSRRIAILKAAGTIAVFLIVYSWIVRPAFLQWGAVPAETGGPWPGQDLFRSGAGGAEPEPGSVRAVTIAAAPAQVWPWLAQIGQTRGGFYFDDWIANLLGRDTVNPARLHREWQPLRSGERVYLAPPHRFGGRAYLVAARVDPPKALVLVSPRDWLAIRDGAKARGFLWSFELRELPGGGARLIARSAGDLSLAWLVFCEPAHFLLERAMLLGIRQRAETMRARPALPGPVHRALGRDTLN